MGKVVANSGISGERVSVYTCTLENYLEKTGYEGITEVVALEEKQMEKWIHENAEITDSVGEEIIQYIEEVQYVEKLQYYGTGSDLMTFEEAVEFLKE